MTHTITSNRKNAAYFGAIYMIGAGLIFAITNTLGQKLTMVYGQIPATIAFWQYFIALLFSLPWVFKHLRSALQTSHIFLHIFRVVLAAGGVQFWILGLAHVPIWQMIALVMTSPFFVSIGALLLLRETVSLQRWLAVFAGFIGGMIILAPWADNFTIAALYPVAAAFLWAMYSLITKHLTATEKPDTLTLYLLLILTPINAALAFDGGFALTTTASIWLVVIAGVLIAVAQYSLVKAYSIADAAYLQPFDHLKLPLNVLLGWLVFGFLPVGTMWLGTALIIGASIYLLSSEARR